LSARAGETEETLGKLLAADPGLRAKISLATKAAPPLDRKVRACRFAVTL
jgi:aryl-alcohol dehydrogenase-like predicted oxidoreductase